MLGRTVSHAVFIIRSGFRLGLYDRIACCCAKRISAWFLFRPRAARISGRLLVAVQVPMSRLSASAYRHLCLRLSLFRFCDATAYATSVAFSP